MRIVIKRSVGLKIIIFVIRISPFLTAVSSSNAELSNIDLSRARKPSSHDDKYIGGTGGDKMLLANDSNLFVKIDDSRVVFGAKCAKVTIVSFIDFQCPYCKTGNNVIKKLLLEYPHDIRLIPKSLPLDFHPLAMPTAKVFEAVRLLDIHKAHRFMDDVYANQRGLFEDRNFVKAEIRKLRLDLDVINAAKESDGVKNIIQDDADEAKKLGIDGTPTYVINGLIIKGAYPFDYFDHQVRLALLAKKPCKPAVRKEKAKPSKVE